MHLRAAECGVKGFGRCLVCTALWMSVSLSLCRVWPLCIGLTCVELQAERPGAPVGAAVLEPLVHGAAGMLVVDPAFQVRPSFGRLRPRACALLLASR